MANSNDPQTHGREVRKETYSDTDGRTNVTKTTETVNGSNSYSNGYVNGQVDERHEENSLVARDNENAGRGLLIGILLASLAALTAGAIWFANQSNDVNTVTPVVLPVPNRVEPSPSPEIRTETTIIEKNTEVLVPIPQQQASPAPQPSTAPDQNINITVPPVASPSPTAEQAPETETAPKESSSSGSDMQSTTPTENSANEDTAPSTDVPATSGSN
jgi:outer membrane biosynthesis protein TonB